MRYEIDTQDLMFRRLLSRCYEPNQDEEAEVGPDSSRFNKSGRFPHQKARRCELKEHRRCNDPRGKTKSRLLVCAGLILYDLPDEGIVYQLVEPHQSNHYKSTSQMD